MTDLPIPTRAAREQLMALINGAWATQAIHTACSLRLPEALAGGAASVESLAQRSGCDTDSLHRLLRALSSLALCTERDDGEFELTSQGALLCDDNPGSVRAWALFSGGPLWARWAELEHSVRTGRCQRLRRTGHDDFSHLDQDRAAAALFNRAMVDATRRVTADVLQAIDFGDARLIVDVGGGTGDLLASILAEYPAAHGVLFDLPHAIDGARAGLSRAGLAGRCQCVAGSFFDGVPAGGDVYLLKSVLHNWDDARCGQLLQALRRAMPHTARVLVIERLAPERYASSEHDRAIARSDLNMLVGLSGRERREAEFRALFAAQGLKLERVVPTPGEFRVLQVAAA